MTATTRHISVTIERSAEDVYKYASNPSNMSEWAAGLAESPLKQQGDIWVADGPIGQVKVAFIEPNAYGVLDHTVTLPDGEEILNPVRVIPNGLDTCEVDFTIRQRNLTDEQFEADASAVAKDLSKLKQILEVEDVKS